MHRMHRNHISSSIILYLILIGTQCYASSDSDDDPYEDGIILHILNSDIDRESWTFPPDPSRDNNMPLSMAIWVSVVLGIFVFMAIAVCCGLFCKYSGKLSSSNHAQPLRSPIPIIITPPSRTPTVSTFQNSTAQEISYENRGYYGEFDTPNRYGTQNASADSPTRDVPPHYTDLSASERVNKSQSRIIAGVIIETPPPAYMTVAPFK